MARPQQRALGDCDGSSQGQSNAGNARPRSFSSDRFEIKGSAVMKVTDAAKLIDISERRFRELIGVDVITRASRGAYEPATFVPEYCRHLRKRASGRPSLDGDARKRLDAARADLAELELAEKKHELIPAQEVADGFSVMVSNMKARLVAIPSKTAPLISPEAPARTEKIIREQIYEALDELSRVKVSASVLDQE